MLRYNSSSLFKESCYEFDCVCGYQCLPRKLEVDGEEMFVESLFLLCITTHIDYEFDCVCGYQCLPRKLEVDGEEMFVESLFLLCITTHIDATSCDMTPTYNTCYCYTAIKS